MIEVPVVVMEEVQVKKTIYMTPENYETLMGTTQAGSDMFYQMEKVLTKDEPNYIQESIHIGDTAY